MTKSHAENGWASDAPTPAQLKEFFAQIDSGRITKGRLQAFLRGETGENNAQYQMAQWADFYQKYFGIRLDVSSIKIPEQKQGFGRLIMVAKGLGLNQVYDVMAKHFACWRYIDDLDKAVPHNDRDPKNGIYAIWVRDRREADEENKGLSANKLKEQGHQGITLLERMLYELKFWDETQEHLDVSNWTLCSGSRVSDGNVPNVNFSGSKVSVYWDHPDSSDDNLRSRSAVS